MMRSSQRNIGGGLRVSSVLGGLVLFALSSCGGRATTNLAATDSESHFLSFCVPGNCSSGLECVFGICTLPCETGAQCAALAPQAACAPAGPADSGVLACELACSTDDECRVAGLEVCSEGTCRDTETPVLKKQTEGCATDVDCEDGLRCLGSACTTTCESDGDCGDGDSCFAGNDRRGQPLRWCETPCLQSTDPALAHDECSFLGAQGRCLVRNVTESLEGSCKQVEKGLCESLDSSGEEWRCFEDIAESQLENNVVASIFEHEMCFGAFTTTRKGVDISVCGDQVCASGRAGCSLSGFEFQPSTRPYVETVIGRPEPMVSLVGELTATSSVPPLVVQLSGEQEATCLFPVEGYTLRTFQVAAWLGQSGFAGQSEAERQIPAVLHGSAVITGEVAEGSERSGGFGEAGDTFPEGSPCELLLESDPRFRFLRAMRTLLSGGMRPWSLKQTEQLECRQCGEIGCEIMCRER